MTGFFTVQIVTPEGIESLNPLIGLHLYSCSTPSGAREAVFADGGSKRESSWPNWAEEVAEFSREFDHLIFVVDIEDSEETGLPSPRRYFVREGRYIVSSGAPSYDEAFSANDKWRILK